MSCPPTLLAARIFELEGPNHAIKLFGIRFVGINAENVKKLLFPLVLIAILVLINLALWGIVHGTTGKNKWIVFWIRQGARLRITIILVIGLLSIWFDKRNPAGGDAVEWDPYEQ